MKIMRLLFALLLSASLFSGCASNTESASSGGSASQETSAPTSASENSDSYVEAPSSTEPSESIKGKILVTYFSCTGNTERIAELIAQRAGADIHQIVPEEPYSPEDLNYRDSSSRSTKEQNDPAARPAISGAADGMENYDIVFLGYPIWSGQAPKIISSFLESYDFSGKTIVPFCTSGSSGIGSSDANLYSLCSDSTRWMPGKRFAASDSQDSVSAWIDDLNILNAGS